MSAPQASDAILFLEDVCRELKVSRRTVERLRRHGAFPIPELPALDKRPRWSRTAVDTFLEQRQLPGHARSVDRRAFSRNLKTVSRKGVA